MRSAASGKNRTVADRVLSISGLGLSFFTEDAELSVLKDVSLEVHAGQTVALVGESGCGKSMTALAVMGLVPEPGRVVSGSIHLGDRSLVGLSDEEFQGIRGREIGMIFQEPMTSLNPIFRIGEQVSEVLLRHLDISPAEARNRTIELLKRVGISSPERRVDEYPHEMSGGMKQRVMIAMAIACKPRLLIADEPTTALDVTIQAQILELLRELQTEMGMAVLLITHNLGVVAHFAERAVVMYAGQVAENADVKTLFRDPLHPYTRGLLGAQPSGGNRNQPLRTIEGTVPAPRNFNAGCRFADRCDQRLDHCESRVPALINRGPEERSVACWLYEGDSKPGKKSEKKENKKSK